MEIEILLEDNHCLVVNKPAGLLSQADQTGDPSLVTWAADYLKARYHKPGSAYVGLVHRLDRPTSGVILLARTSKAASRLSKQFREGAIAKLYWAIVEGHPRQDEGVWVDFLEKNARENRVRVVDPAADRTRRAEVSYRVLKSGASRSVAAGDGHRRIALHARELCFRHPTRGEVISVVAPAPADWPEFATPLWERPSGSNRPGGTRDL